MRTKTIVAVFTLAALGATAVYADKSMKDADANDDGFVSLDEMKSVHSARLEERFASLDTNADGLLSTDEMAAAKEARRADHDKRRDGRRHGKRNPEKMFNKLDADGSGGLSLTELEGKRFSPDLATFQAADTDVSGELEASEMQAMMKARWAERRGADSDKS